MLQDATEERLQALIAAEPRSSKEQVEKFLDCGWGLIPGMVTRTWNDWSDRKGHAIAARKELERRGLFTNIPALDP